MGRLEQGQTLKAPAKCLAHPTTRMGLLKEETSSGPDSREQSLQGGQPAPQGRGKPEGWWPVPSLSRPQPCLPTPYFACVHSERLLSSPLCRPVSPRCVLGPPLPRVLPFILGDLATPRGELDPNGCSNRPGEP